MTFETKSSELSSDKFYMVRLEGARVFTAENMAQNGGFTNIGTAQIFSVFESYIPKFIHVNNLTFRKSGSDSELSFARVDELVDTITTSSYSYDPETGLLRFATDIVFTFDGTLAVPSTHTIAISYYLFFTQYLGKFAPLSMASGDEVYWAPRIDKDASLGYSQENNLQGTLSVSSSGLQLKNHDLYFNEFFSTHDSFNNREVKVWRCLDSVNNYQFEFSGVIRGADLDDEKVSFEITDITAILDDKYIAGYGAYLRFSDFHNGSTYIVRGDDQDKAITRQIGKLGPYEVFYYNTAQDRQVRFLDPIKMLSAVCVSYNPNSKTTSTNRKWSCGFGSSVAIASGLICTAVTNTAIGTYAFTQMTVDTSLKKAEQVFAVGDTFKIGVEYGFVVYAHNNTVVTWPRNLSITTGPITREKVGAVVIRKGDQTYYPKGTADYDCAIGPNGDMQITFKNNFEAGYAGLTTLDPDTCEVFFRMWNDDTDARSSQVCKNILSASGLDVASDFMPDQTNAWPDPDLAFTIPFLGENDFPTYSDVLERCLKSSLSFIYLDNLGQFRYKSFLDYIRAQVDIVNESGIDPDLALDANTSSSFSASFDFYDQYVATRFKSAYQPSSNDTNVDNSSKAYLFEGYTGGYRERKLYGSNRVYDSETLLDLHGMAPRGSGVASVIEPILIAYNELMTGRRVLYRLTAFSKHFKMYVGDDILVSRAKIIGGENSQYMRVVAINKDVNESRLTLIDLKKFPK